jgi:hypothetical protein
MPRLQGRKLPKALFLDNRLDDRQRITRLDSLLIVCFEVVTEIVAEGDFKPLKLVRLPFRDFREESELRV